jgi:hypothetical protein
MTAVCQPEHRTPTMRSASAFKIELACSLDKYGEVYCAKKPWQQQGQATCKAMQADAQATSKTQIGPGPAIVGTLVANVVGPYQAIQLAQILRNSLAH